jgi:hypothetical protein
VLKVPRHLVVGGAVAVIIEDQQGVIVVMRVMIAKGSGPECRLEALWLQDVLRWPETFHTAVQESYQVAVASLVEVVRGQYDACAGSCQFGNQVEDPFLTGQIESGDGLIEEEQSGTLNESLSYQYPLALASGQLAELPVEEILDGHTLAGLVDGFAVDGAEPPMSPFRSVAAHS